MADSHPSMNDDGERRAVDDEINREEQYRDMWPDDDIPDDGTAHDIYKQAMFYDGEHRRLMHAHLQQITERLSYAIGEVQEVMQEMLEAPLWGGGLPLNNQKWARRLNKLTLHLIRGFTKTGGVPPNEHPYAHLSDDGPDTD